MGAQKTLLANASHELRSPLARIRMAIELLQEAAPPAVRGSHVSATIQPAYPPIFIG
jgi:signal transduction histidine kinase